MDTVGDYGVLIGAISSLTAVEELRLWGFHSLGRPADLAAALQPLQCLRALVGDDWGF